MKTILIVDDDATTREFMGSILEKRGYRVLSASTGGEAIALAGDELPDLAIIDINLPDVSGTQVAKSLSDDPRTKGIPYFFLTGMLSRDEEGLLRNTLGGNFFLAKPCDTDVLLDAIARRIR